MRKVSLLVLTLVLQVFPVRMLASRTVEIQPGQLQHMFDVYHLTEETDLKIKGKINGSDINVIRNWTNIQKSLDLSECRIVAGGDPYYKDYTTEDDVIGPYMFSEHVFKTLVMPNTLKRIEEHAFKYCGDSIVLPPTLERIGDYAFESTGKYISFPSSLAWIGDFAFANNSLEEINLPASLVHIGNCAFNGWPLIRKATVDDANPEFVVEDGYLYTRDHTRLLSYFAPERGGWAECFTLHPEVKVVDDMAFNCARAYNIKLNDKLEHIGEEAFRYVMKDMFPHDKPVKLVIPNSVTYIGVNAFQECMIDTLILSDNLEYLPDHAFESCRIQHIHLPAKLKHIGVFALGDNFLYNLVLPDGLETIEEYGLWRCGGRKLVIPESVSRIDEFALANCPSDTIEILAPLESISDNAFRECSYLTKLTLPPTVKRIGSYAFYRSSLTDCKLPNGLEEIGSYALTGAMFMEEWHIPASVRKIEGAAFQSPFFAHTVYMYSSEPPADTDPDAFYDWPMVDCTLYVPEGCTERYQHTAPWNTFGTIREFQASGVNSITRTLDDAEQRSYDISGRPISDGQRGLRIVVTKHGVKKVFK